MSNKKRLLLPVLLVGMCIPIGSWLLIAPDGTNHQALSRPTPTWVNQITPETKAGRPNILLVVYDARRRDDFSFGPFGNQRGDTPFLAGFAKDSLFFENAIAPGAWTVPSHASMFSGLSVGDLDIDYLCDGWSSFPTEFLSLAEVLRWAGYHTVAYADHPFFFSHYHKNVELSLIRGFEQFSVVGDSVSYGTYTNINSKRHRVDHHHKLAGMDGMSFEELKRLIKRFNAGELRFDLSEDGDYDPVNKLYLAKLYDIFKESQFFQKRYGREFDQDVFKEDDDRPFFLFANLHFCALSCPDLGLWHRWLLKTVMLNAQAKGQMLVNDRAGALLMGERDVFYCLRRNFLRLDLDPGLLQPLRPAGFEMLPLKHLFDNRFCDATFRALWEYLSGRGLTENTVAIICSDHGMSSGGHGESFYFHGGARPTEDLVQVPLVIRFPASSELATLHGRRSERVNLTDLFMTMVDLGLGDGVFRRSLPVRGRSLVQRAAANDFEQVVFTESMLRPESYTIMPNVAGYSRAVYFGNMKLIYAPKLYDLSGGWTLNKPPTEDRRLNGSLVLLYDLSADPFEQSDLARQRGAVVEKLVSMYSQIGIYDIRRTVAVTPDWDEEALETLRALGYVD